MGHQHFTSAIQHLNFTEESLPNYNAFINALVLSAKNTEEHIIDCSVWGTIDFEKVFLAFYAFKGAWTDRSNDDPTQKAKFEMDYHIKLMIHNNLKILERKILDYRDYLLKKIALEKHYQDKAHELMKFNFLSQALLEELDMNACLAIKNYQTLLHKRIKKAAKLENHVSAVSFGFAETMISVTALVSGLAGVKITWNILSYLLGTLCGLVSWLASLNTSEPHIFSIFNKLFGEGSFRYYYCKTTGRYEKLTNTQMTQLGVFGIIAAIVGLGSGGAVAYTSFLGLTSLPWLIGIAGVSAACPPIGIAFAAFVTIGTFCMLVNDFYHKILTAGDPKQSLSSKIGALFQQPFDELNKVIASWNLQPGLKKWIVQGFCVALTFCFCGIGVVALGISSWNNANSFSKFNKNIFFAGPKLAKVLGIAIGGVVNAVGRVFFVLSSAIRCFTTFLNSKGKEISRSKFIVGGLETIARFAFAMVSFEKNGGQSQSRSIELASISAGRTFLFNTAQIIKDIKSESTIENDKKRIHNLKKIAKKKIQPDRCKSSKVILPEADNSIPRIDINNDAVSGVYAFKQVYLAENPKASFKKLIQGEKVVNMGLFYRLADKDPVVNKVLKKMGLAGG